MGRTSVKVITQKDDVSCGPASLKHAMEIFGFRKSVTYLQSLCNTTKNGTSTANMIRAIRRLGYAVLTVEYATLTHLTSALKHTPRKPRALIVSYLYGEDDEISTVESGHWATVSSYNARDGKIVLFDSYSGTKKSYVWKFFRTLWKDYDRVRKPIFKLKRQIRIVRKWQHKLLLVVAKDVQDLPKFRSPYTKIYA